MSANPKVGVVIAAAGSSSRYGGTTLKQLEDLNGDPLYLHSLKTALGTPGVDQVVLVVPIAAAESGDMRKCRPIGCYDAAAHLAERYWEDR